VIWVLELGLVVVLVGKICAGPERGLCDGRGGFVLSEFQGLQEPFLFVRRQCLVLNFVDDEPFVGSQSLMSVGTAS
jgi:hypothetical protein